MCELLGMSANVPTDIVFSFTGLMQRGGSTGPHRDGWGIGFYEGRGLRLFRDPQPGTNSRVAELVRNYPIKSTNVIGHVRQANVGAINLANTHPFVREMWGENWCFAHNGQLKDFTVEKGFYQPIGSTDSEACFCAMLNRLRQRFDAPPGADDLLSVMVESCRRFQQLGVFNCLLSNGEWLFSYCSSKLVHITRRAPFGPATLKDADLTVDFHTQTTPNASVTGIATEPLTNNESWGTHAPGEWRLWQDGVTSARGQSAQS
ncbi:MAG: class II glutamine amidotransferase [Sinobacteraceae bacterium]|nr:class II glutamine amidotransferase [Nevskiaceae bacterium]